VYTRTKRLDSITTLRGTSPSAEAQNFTNYKIDTGKESFRPTRLGCAEGWEKTGGVNGVRPVDKL
jgi:hypothetical protein